jgi:glutamate 5-kinase
MEQAVAAVGQSLLMETYHNIFEKEGITIAQVLLTRDDFTNRKRYLNAANTINTLLELKVLPVINENDTVAVDELQYANKFGDNDVLAGLVTNLVRAGLLIILTDVEGLYGKDNKDEIINFVEKITPDIERIARGTKKDTSRGGMSSKLKAATLVTSGGGMVIIASGLRKTVLEDIMKGEHIGTLFVPTSRKIRGKKFWLAFTNTPCGSVYIDDGAKLAILQKGTSLLPAGIKATGGDFNCGDLVSIMDGMGKEIARGLTNFSKDEVEKIKGLKSAGIEAVLGAKPYEEVIHRNNMVIMV